MALALAAVALVTSISPTSPEVKDVVFTLVKNADSLTVLEERNKCLRRAFVSETPYDQIVFHEGNIPSTEQERLVAKNAQLRFVDVHEAFTVPPGGSPPATPAATRAARTRPGRVDAQPRLRRTPRAPTDCRAASRARAQSPSPTRSSGARWRGRSHTGTCATSCRRRGSRSSPRTSTPCASTMT